MSNPTLTKNFNAGAAIAAYRIVKMGAADATVVQGAAATDFLMGVCTEIAAASGGRADVHIAGVADVEFGGTVTRGDEVTSDATGKAVAAAPAAGVNNRIIGLALVSAVSGQIAPVLLAPGVMQG